MRGLIAGGALSLLLSIPIAPASDIVLGLRSSLSDSNSFGLTIGCVRSADVTLSAEERGLSTGLTSVQVILLVNEIILFERFGNSGAIDTDRIDIVSEKSDADDAIELRLICDCENDGTEPPCMFTLANTEKS